MFQNLVADIAKVQTLGGVILLGGDFNARTAALPNTLDTSDLCEHKRLSSLRLSNQVLWLRDKTVMLVLAVGAASS